MNNRDRTSAVLHYRPYDRLPLVHFGYWWETLQKWVAEGHLAPEDVAGFGDGNAKDRALSARLGFDFNWQTMYGGNSGLMPGFDTTVLRELPDGSRHVRNSDGVVELHRANAQGIPSEIDHLLNDRASWEEHYRWRYPWAEGRVDTQLLAQLAAEPRESPLGLHCGSLLGHVRNVLGLENLSYLYVDDEPLFREIIDTVAELCYRNVEFILGAGVRFDFAHFWEDICFKNGPLISPAVFRDCVGPHYRRITNLVRSNGIDIISLDCDGCIDALIPIWFDNGVNTMFPIEVGTWEASIGPWRERYGRGLLGVGGMNKTVFARDRAAVDAEIERLRRLVDLGGYIPCPDHRIAPDAQWDNVRYYCDRMRAVF